MKVQTKSFQTISFDDEGHLQDVLAPKSVGAQSTADDLKRELAKGLPVVVEVPGELPRVLVSKQSIEKLVGHPLPGGDLLVIPFG
jgi:hypothetical protein